MVSTEPACPLVAEIESIQNKGVAESYVTQVQEKQRREKARLDEIARREAAKKALEELQKSITEGGVPAVKKTTKKKTETKKPETVPEPNDGTEIVTKGDQN